MDFCVKFFRDLFKRSTCFRTIDSRETMMNETTTRSNKQNSIQSDGSVHSSRRNSLFRFFNNKQKRFINYKPTKKYKRNKSKEESIYLERNQNDDSVLTFQLNKKSKQQLLLNDNENL